jgi:hypothetical protein
MPPTDATLYRRLQSRLDLVTHAVSYATAVGTLFQAAAKWEETVNFVIDHPLTSLVCLLALAALFASTLLQGLRFGLPWWAGKRPRQEPIGRDVRAAGAGSRPAVAESDQRQPTHAPAAIRQPPRWNRAIVAAGSLATALALGVVVVLLYLSTTGVHYVLLESAPTYDVAAQRAAEINRALAHSGEVAHARPQRPHFSNPNSAILVGPYFSRGEAEETLARLRSNSSYQVRKDAWVISYSLTDVQEAAARFLGWKTP